MAIEGTDFELVDFVDEFLDVVALVELAHFAELELVCVDVVGLVEGLVAVGVVGFGGWLLVEACFEVGLDELGPGSLEQLGLDAVLDEGDVVFFGVLGCPRIGRGEWYLICW